MTENEKITINGKEVTLYREVETNLYRFSKDAVDMLLEALEEREQYRAIGTIDEFKALKEKSVAKKPEIDEFDYGEIFVCGECESFLHYVDDDDEHIRTNYCCHCGTRIDWSE